MGLPVRKGVNENDLPDDFKNIDPDKEYIWAYQRLSNQTDIFKVEDVASISLK